MKSAAEMALGRWKGILKRLDVDPALLTGKHVDCPLCGRKKKFRFDDKNEGRWICLCQAGDGFDLLQLLKGMTFKEAADAVEREAGFVTENRVIAPSNEAKLAALQRVWRQSQQITPGDAVCRYIERRSRGRLHYDGSQNVRLHPGLPYKNEDGEVIGTYPVMLLRVSDPRDHGVSIHRTYLTPDGRKAPGGEAKQLMPGLGVAGAAVRLSPVARCLGTAEGYETSLAASRLFGMPVWPTISAYGMDTFIPPEGVEELDIFGDNDTSFTGQAAAYALAKRLTAKGYLCRVHIPSRPDTDWLDVLLAEEEL